MSKLDTIILKVAAPCNLDCAYCYEYNRGDDSWKRKPKSISSDTLEAVGRRLAEYGVAESIDVFRVNLHGGEPMLLGAAGLDAAIKTLRETASPVRLAFGMQTNATLATAEIIDVLRRHRVAVGVSLDGGPWANRFRVDHQGRSSYERAVAGIHRIRDAGLFAGIQAVIELDSDPCDVLDTLANFNPPRIELGQPFGSHSNPPRGSTRYRLSEWLLDCYAYWKATPRLSRIPITVLQDALVAIISDRSHSDWFPGAPPGYIIVATDGSYEGLDTLKIAGAAGRETAMNVSTNNMHEVLAHPHVSARIDMDRLSDQCKRCAIRPWCNGGYYPTRYSDERGFDNPSYYCTELKDLFAGLARDVLSSGRIKEEQRRTILMRLHQLEVSNGT